MVLVKTAFGANELSLEGCAIGPNFKSQTVILIVSDTCGSRLRSAITGDDDQYDALLPRIFSFPLFWLLACL